MALRAGTKRARPTTPTAATAPGKCASGEDYSLRMEIDVELELGPQRSPRRKRPSLRFLEKMPPLRDYQRGRFGRRGGVDGGAPNGGPLWMQALEESMEETSFVTREAPDRAAVVAPVTVAPAVNATAPRVTSLNRSARASAAWDRSAWVPLSTARPLAAAPSGVIRAPQVDDEIARQRRLFILQAAAGGGKDDEARPAV